MTCRIWKGPYDSEAEVCQTEPLRQLALCESCQALHDLALPADSGTQVKLCSSTAMFADGEGRDLKATNANLPMVRLFSQSSSPPWAIIVRVEQFVGACSCSVSCSCSSPHYYRTTRGWGSIPAAIEHVT